MSLKRKASFTTLTSPRPSSSYNATVSPVPVCPGDVITIDETPRHLHSRTRKRFKNDRPDDQSLYDKTISWLFSAQKQLNNRNSSMSCTPAEPVADEPLQNTSTILEPMQQTLQRFFQPTQHRTHSHTPLLGSGGGGYRDGDFVPHVDSVAMPSGGSSSSKDIEMDMGMSMDIDARPSGGVPSSDAHKKWVGGIGWM